MNNRRYYITIAVISSCIFILTGIFAYQNWRPKSKAAVLANVNDTYDHYFNPVNGYLQNHDLHFAPDHAHHPQDKQGGCIDELLENDLLYGTKPGERIPVTCLKMDSIRPMKFDSSFQSNWQQVSPGLEQFLQTQGWHKEYPDQTAVADLFHHPKDNASFLSYVKYNRKIKCLITFDYNPPYPNPADQMWIGEDCRQTI